MIKTSIFRLQINCPGCGMLHSVGGIADTENCQNCGSNINISAVILDKIFGIAEREHYLNNYLSGNIEQTGGASGYKLEYSSAEPYCEECFAPAAISSIIEVIDSGKPYSCNACGHIMPIKTAGAEAKALHKNAIAVLNDAYGIDAGRGEAGKELVLVFKCMTCGSGLELSSKTERTMKCTYCSNENYLPDSIWLKLHPGEKAQPLFLLIDVSQDDIKSSVNYFMRVNALAIYEKHFENFIREYFEKPFISDAFLAWLKFFLSAEKDNNTGFGLDPAKPQRSFLNNLKLGYDSYPEEIRAAAAKYSSNIPLDLQHLMAEDKSDKIRLAFAANTSIHKDISEVLQDDHNNEISAMAKKNKKGFFKSLFG